MHCNRFIGLTLVSIVALRSAAAVTYQERALSYKYLDEPLDEAGLSLKAFWQGTSEPLPV